MQETLNGKVSALATDVKRKISFYSKTSMYTLFMNGLKVVTVNILWKRKTESQK